MTTWLPDGFQGRQMRTPRHKMHTIITALFTVGLTSTAGAELWRAFLFRSFIDFIAVLILILRWERGRDPAEPGPRPGRGCRHSVPSQKVGT